MSSSTNRVLYICDGHACEGKEDWHECGECRHTEKYEHALYKYSDTRRFERFGDFLVEKRDD